MRANLILRATFCVSTALAAACNQTDLRSDAKQTRATSVAVLTRAPTAAEAVLDDFLSRATVMMSAAAQPNSLFACERYGSGNPELALAKYRVLGSRMLGDTAVVRAAVVSIAQVRLKEQVYEVTQGIRQDTLSWSLVRVPNTSRWGICGFSREGPDFLRIQYLSSGARWLGGASLASVVRLADSVAKAP